MQPRDDSDRQLRQRQLLELLRHLADRIHAVQADPDLIDMAELDHLLGNARSALAHMHDYDSSSDHQRIVDEARQSSISFDQTGEE